MIWKASYLIGMDQLDQQHKQMVMTLDDLQKALAREDGCTEGECKEVVNFLKSFVVVHFGAEEMYMEEIGFPHLAAHRKMHEGFKTRLHEIDLALMRSGYDQAVIKELGEMMTKWWLWHIIKEDKKMKKYMPK